MTAPSASAAPRRRVTVPALRAMKAEGVRLTMVTAYDAVFARMFDEAGADMLLVGDSLGMVIQGLDSTLPVTLDDVLYHCRAVARGAQRAHIVADMPFMTYQVSLEDALRNAGRLMSEGHAHSVKIEGGLEMAETVRRMVAAGIPVVGHVGLTPQSVHAMGGFKVQGKTREQAERVLEGARAVAEAGAFAVVLEGVPTDLGTRVTEALDVPTIGIGAGPHCDGQVLVGYDLLGLTPNLKPKFVKHYDDFYERGKAACQAYCHEVRSGAFPAPEHCFGLPKREVREPARPADVLDATPVAGTGYGPTH